MAMEAKILPDSFNPLFFDAIASHFVQSWQWGEVRKKTDVKVVKIGFFQGGTLSNTAQITFHKLPKINKTMGHLARCRSLSREELDELVKIGKDHNAIAIRIEPNLYTVDPVIPGSEERATPESSNEQSTDPGLSSSASWRTDSARMADNHWPPSHPNLKKSSQYVFVPNNFLLDLTKSEDDLLAAMHPKTRYNIRVAQKNGVVIEEQTNRETLEQFIALQKKTSKRQQFYLHPDDYYRTVFSELFPQKMVRLLVAKHPQGQVISIWFLVTFKETITYLYGAFDHEYRHLMANNLIAWEAMRLGKRLGLKTFDFGGTYSNISNPKDPRFGVHRFKSGFGARHVTYVGTFDLIVEPYWYYLFTFANTLRWWLLRLKKQHG